MLSDITLENYDEKRNELLIANSNLNAVILREKELSADIFLSELKDEYYRTVDSADKFSVPVLTDRKIRESRLYKFCSRLPKGADLHVHDMALLPLNELVPLLASCPEFCINTDKSRCDLISVSPDSPVPQGYIRFFDAVESGIYSNEDFLSGWTVEGAKTSSMGIWDFFELLFDRQACLSGNPAFAAKYYDRAFRYYCRIGIIHVEIHLMLTDSIDESGDYVKVIRQAYYDVKKDYPYFTVRIIGAGVKADSDNIDMTKQCFLNTSYVRETVRDESDPCEVSDFVIGFDLVNEEDTSLPLKKFAPMLMKVKRRFPGMNLYIHGGESLDASNENLIDAYLLGVSRVGHGLNLYRYPDLHSRYVKAEICLEVCPVSNQRLGYTVDIRNHPATEYLRTGMAISLCSDDPAYMEYETLTDDFFAAVSGWNLGLADIKQLAINSIMYSGLTERQKTQSLKAYNRLWNEFIDGICESLC